MMSGHWKPKRTSCSRVGARFGCLKPWLPFGLGGGGNGGLTKRASCSWVGGRLGSLKAGVMRGSASGFGAGGPCITGLGGGMAAASAAAASAAVLCRALCASAAAASAGFGWITSKMVPPSGIAFAAALASSLGK